ncbi:Anthranilate synthase component 2 [Taphrina deformans PYCC 5710]|uniref:Multifunctional tryptophan biosynthesis protein n=1 Tax=Taphrina deformans (strain PYCC 5710 / ATCC 11124 / CBS 356.35 / IMI 108563 / JCM 9778 / NBRC 8474) TaxID=1097556 RepID=R4XHU7_TAPDE|nr:Anthranilate synthase component 2 [Taphrina deformans PYCC 5710]|eukprot:CCG82987.1 Anthranilate synthase component 2 [Taphrina deformans PYCC 5710]
MVDAHDIVVIDNYDSFTWNIVEYVSAITDRNIEVFRNDKITLEDLDALRPKLLIISPGPGHPDTDAGISSDAISMLKGRIPILGVCMGQQCMFTVFGGKVEQTGEILHGKTSLVQHDGKGIYAGIPQNIAVTRYHSLAGTKTTLPDCLETTCWTESGIIMGVRHKTYAIEGVQYHPESILSEGGKSMFKNFLQLKAGTWAEHEKLQMKKTSSERQSNDDTNGKKKKTILETIHEQRLLDVAAAKATPGATPEDLRTLLELNIAPPQIDFASRVRQNVPEPAVMAEIKRASPSKGDIDLSANAARQALLYARGGASVISVLTEPKWFKGSLNDLRAARDAIQGLPNRPALLRKDFIIDRYQIDEARVYGADTVLLIVAMLSEEALFDLYAYAQSLNMEPLVEVNNQTEMKLAMKLGAKVIGVNNRNLHDFVVDLETTSTLAKDLAEGVTLCALSGITGRADVEKYISEGVGAVLVGEALMRSHDKGQFIDALLGKETKESTSSKVERRTPMVKICGTRTAEAAIAAADAGADFIGMIFAEGRKRTISVATASEIVSAVRTRRTKSSSSSSSSSSSAGSAARALPLGRNDWFSYQADILANAPQKPLFVGVFQNQPLETILRAKYAVPLDIVQLHGDEPLEWCTLIPGPVIRAFDVTEPAVSKAGYHVLPILDATSREGVKGGSGAQLDWDRARRIIEDNGGMPVLLAGGLKPENVAEALRKTGAVGVDVSSGVETDGAQDLDKIRLFVENAKA